MAQQTQQQHLFVPANLLSIQLALYLSLSLLRMRNLRLPALKLQLLSAFGISLTLFQVLLLFFSLCFLVFSNLFVALRSFIMQMAALV